MRQGQGRGRATAATACGGSLAMLGRQGTVCKLASLKQADLSAQSADTPPPCASQRCTHPAPALPLPHAGHFSLDKITT